MKKTFLLVLIIISSFSACGSVSDSNAAESAALTPSAQSATSSADREQLIEPKNWEPKPGGIVTYPAPLNGEDGMLFGYPLSFDPESNTLLFDPAEWWTAGDDMEKLAEIELDLGSLPSGFYLFNPRVEEWTFTVTPDAEIQLLQPPNYSTVATETIETLYQRVSSHAQYMSVHITIKNNQVVSLTEQYRP